MANSLIVMFFSRERSAMQHSLVILLVVNTETLNLGTSRLSGRVVEGKVFKVYGRAKGPNK